MITTRLLRVVRCVNTEVHQVGDFLPARKALILTARPQTDREHVESRHPLLPSIFDLIERLNDRAIIGVGAIGQQTSIGRIRQQRDIAARACAPQRNPQRPDDECSASP